MRVDDRLLALVACLLGIAILLHIRSYPEIPGHFYGPALFPGLVGWGFVVFGVLLGIRTIRRGQGASGPWLAFPEWSGNVKGGVGAGLMLLAILGFMYLGDVAGFPLLSICTLAALYLWAGRGVLFSIALAVAVTIVFDLLFSRLLSVPMPTGLLSPIWW